MSAYNKNDPATIKRMFNDIATRYDRANAVLSFNLHKQWNSKLVNEVLLRDTPHTFLDLCSGTGDIALNYLLNADAPCRAYLIDFSANMLSRAKNKLDSPSFENHQIDYVEADVQSLPLGDNCIDSASMAYGIRNVKNPSQSLSEVYRVLKPGGKVGLLELTQPQNSLLKFGHFIYLKTILPILGKIVTNNQDAYNYLQGSIRTFISPTELEKIMVDSGLTQIKRLPLAGGIATILVGTKASQ